MGNSLTFWLLVYLHLGWVSSNKHMESSNNWMKIKEIKNNVAETSESSKVNTKTVMEYGSINQISVMNPSKPSESYIEKMDTDFLKYLRVQKTHMKSVKNTQNFYDSFFSSISIPFKFWRFLADLGQRDISKLGSFQTTPLDEPYLTSKTKHLRLRSWKVSAYAVIYDDPLWRKQWYMQDYRTKKGPVMDLNVVPVYSKLGFTGRGINIAVVDDGIIRGIPDLKDNFDETISFNVCENKPGCEPPLVLGHRDSHGTKSAGVIAMKPNNKICGVGIAYGAKVAGIRAICDSRQDQDIIAKALVHGLGTFHIYLSSWSFDDFTKHVRLLKQSMKDAYIKGVKEGRDKKGVIYVNSAGNVGVLGDSCSLDCNLNVPEVIAIGAANQFGKRSDFSKQCTAIFAVTYSSSKSTEGVVTVNEDGRCIKDFGRTDAAASLAAGIIALTLEANGQLTYRDVMHLIAMSSEVAPLAENYYSWYKNGRGFWVSNSFGFGLMNAENMVRMATSNWQTVPEKHTCTLNIKLHPYKYISRGEKVPIAFETDACASSETDSVRFLQHLEVKCVVLFPGRGDISITITSPAVGNLAKETPTIRLAISISSGAVKRESESGYRWRIFEAKTKPTAAVGKMLICHCIYSHKGTKSNILERRKRDPYRERIDGLSIMSVHNWGEDPRGKWFFEVAVDKSNPVTEAGFIGDFEVIFHGTYDMPRHYKNRRTYSAFFTSDGKSNVAT